MFSRNKTSPNSSTMKFLLILAMMAPLFDIASAITALRVFTSTAASDSCIPHAGGWIHPDCHCRGEGTSAIFLTEGGRNDSGCLTLTEPSKCTHIEQMSHDASTYLLYCYVWLYSDTQCKKDEKMVKTQGWGMPGGMTPGPGWSYTTWKSIWVKCYDHSIPVPNF